MKKQISFSLDNIPGSFKKRVFIGGDYRNIAILQEIKKIVSKLGFQPLLLTDFTVPTKSEYESALFLLSKCKFAIFEVTYHSGANMEFPRCEDYKVRVLLIHQTLFVQTEHISLMISSFVKSYKNAQLWTYPNFSEMKKIIKKWLSSQV